MTTGRPPNPAALTLVTGNRGRRPVENGDGVQISPELPPAPAFLLPDARAEWDRIGPKLELLGLVTQIDMAMLAMYCQSYARWQHAERQMEKMAAASEASGGMIVKSPNGYPQISPWLVIANKSMEQCRSYAIEFGLSPAARARVKAMAVQGDLFGGGGGDPLQQYLAASKKIA